MSNVIIIGSSGFLGSAVTHELLANGCQVFATKNRRPVPAAPGLTVINGGIMGLTTEVIDRIRPEAIFHCARPVIPQLRRLGRMIAALRAKQNNRFLLSQIAVSQCKPSLLFASGSLVYGNSCIPHTEDAPLSPVSYARQYHRGESPVVQAVSEYNMKVVMLRFPWLLGNGSWFSWFYMRPLQDKKLVPLFGDGSNMMSVISLKDAARIMVRFFYTGIGNGIYNVYSPLKTTQLSFAGLVAGHYGGKVTAYRNIYPRDVEKAVYEAFTSNILLDSKHLELLNDYPFQSLEEMLEEIKLPAGI